MERNDDSIDLSRLFQIMGNHKSVIVGIISICTIVAVVISFALPKQYASTTLVQVRSDGSVGATTALAALGAGRLNAPTMSYIELMKTRTVIEPVIDLLEFEEDERPTAEKFAKTYLEITNPKESNLIEVKAIWENPETAQQISKAVVDNFLQMQTDMNQQTQSLLLKFLEKRIVESKEASEVAEEKLLIFSKEHKIYSPDDQVKNVVTQMASYDKAMADFEVSIQSEQASLDAANAALEDQKMNSRIYNISDNEIVQSLRSQIVAKQLELVGLRQSYTEKHPSLQKALGELQQLENSLHSEVVATVDSNVVTLNPAQAEILKNKCLQRWTFLLQKPVRKPLKRSGARKKKNLENFLMKSLNMPAYSVTCPSKTRFT